MALDVKGAVQTARAALSEVLQIPEQVLLLEEVERNGSSWDVTFSYPDSGSATLANILGNRKYKVVKIDAMTGAFISVKIRSVIYERSA